MKKQLVKMLHIVQVLVLLAAIVAVPVSLGTKQVEAAEGYASTTPPGGVYNPPYVFPTYYNRYTGIGVTTSKGAVPQLDSTYVPANQSKDPWAGGVYTVNWRSKVDASVVGGGGALTADNGLGFVAHVNLPDGVEAIHVRDAIIKNSASLTIDKDGNKKVFQLSEKNFEAIGPHTLRLTLRKWTNDGLLSDLINWLVKNLLNGKDANNIDVYFTVGVDVAAMMKDGATNDTSPNKVLTKGKFPPGLDGQLGLSVDFYGKDQIVEEYQANGAWGLPAADPLKNTSTKLFAKLNADGTFKESNRATTSLSTWDKYISPADSKGVYNTNNDPTETVNGSSANLPGTVGARTLTPNRAVETFDEIMAADPTRFNRVLNFFTKQPVTEGISLSASPLTTPTISNIVITPESNPLPEQKTLVTFSGKVGSDPSGALSPTTMTVVDQWNHPTVAPTNMKDYIYAGGAFPVPGAIVSTKDRFVLKFNWKSNYLKTGKIHYRLVDIGNQLVPGYEDLTKEISSGGSSAGSFDTEVQLGQLPVGFYRVDYKIIDDYRPNDPYDNQWESQKHGLTNILAVVDAPSVLASSVIKNLNSSDPSAKNAVTAVKGDVIEHDGSFQMDYAGATTGTTVTNRRIHVALPEGTEYVKGSLFFELDEKGKVKKYPVDDKDMVANKQIDIQLPKDISFDVGDVLRVGYQTKVTGTPGTTIITPAMGFLADVTYENQGTNVSGPMSPAYTNTNTINIPVQEFKLLKVPSDLGFGTLAKPAFSQDVPLASGDFSFGVRNTYSDSNHDQWQITATLAQGFQSTTDNQPLAGSSLIFKSGKATQELSPTSATNIYTGNQKGDIPVTFSGKDGLYLHLEPNPNVEMNTEYTSTITWALTNGPGS